MKVLRTFVCVTGALLCVGTVRATSLQEAFKGQFMIGTALNDAQSGEKDPAETALIKAQFNSITPENAMKWEVIEPHPNQFEFAAADRFVEFGTRNNMFIVGHNLVWHSQTPDWVFKDAAGASVDRETLLRRMRDHIQAVVGRYRGRVSGWDVVNEILDENGALRDSPWLKIIGDDYVAQAFQFAHEADPQAELYYNDYGIEVGAKRAGAIALVKKLKNSGVPITAVGIQEHVILNWPSPQNIEEAITSFGKLGVKVMITELDVDVLPARNRSLNADVSRSEAVDAALNPYTAGLPDKVQQALARRYAKLFALYLKHRDTVQRVTLWGVFDRDSWLNDWPIKGRTSYPLLFDRTGRPKPAYDRIIKLTKPVPPANVLTTQSMPARR